VARLGDGDGRWSVLRFQFLRGFQARRALGVGFFTWCLAPPPAKPDRFCVHLQAATPEYQPMPLMCAHLKQGSPSRVPVRAIVLRADRSVARYIHLHRIIWRWK
jgi:hypothetical protein